MGIYIFRMFNPSDFTAEQKQEALAMLKGFHEDKETLKKGIEDYFTEFDKDGNGYLDRRELRHFLQFFFQKWNVHLPLTDEFVDDVYRQIDVNHDNKLEQSELFDYASPFVTQLYNMFN